MDSPPRTAKKLTPAEVNRIIQPKICKVVTKYGTGAGYFVRPALGLLMSSFHLVGAMRPKSIEGRYPEILLAILLQQGYVSYTDERWDVTDKIACMSSAARFLLSFNINISELFLPCVQRVSVEEMLAFLHDEHWNAESIFERLRSKAVGESSAFASSDTDRVLSAILMSNDYLDATGCITSKMHSLTSVDDFVIAEPSENVKFFSCKRFSDAEVRDFQSTHFMTQEALFIDLKQCFADKEVFLYPSSDQITIQFAGETLRGKVTFPSYLDAEKMRLNYAYYNTALIQVTHFPDGSVFKQGHAFINTGYPIESVMSGMEIGERVYYAGYPDAGDYLFCQNMIASISESLHRRKIKLDISIASESLGAPIFMQRDGALYFLAIMSSEKGRAVIIDFEKWLNPDLGIAETLLDEFYDFCPMKRYESDVEAEVLPLLSYMLEHNLMRRLTKKNFCDYLTAHTDFTTRAVILSAARHQLLNDEDAFIFPEFKAEKIESDAVEDEQLIVHRADPEKAASAREALRHLHSCVINVSRGRLQHGLFYYGALGDPTIPVVHDICMTKKFHEHHFGGRRIEPVSVSTLIADTAITPINDELRAHQLFYARAFKLLAAQAKARDKIIIGLYFLSINAYPLRVCSNPTAEEIHKTSRFFYSVVSNSATFFMHHYAGTDIDPQWQPLVVDSFSVGAEPSVPLVYYEEDSLESSRSRRTL